MRHVLIINPNTRQALTAQLVDQISQVLADTGLAVMGVTAPFGSDYIASEQSYVVAAHAVLDAWQAHVIEHGLPRAVLVACFGDPGVWALRETTGVPVMGLAEAAMREADALGPFAIVTGGAAWGPMLERLARGLQLAGAGRLRWVRTVDASGSQLASDADAGLRAIAMACEQVMADDAAHLAAHRIALGQTPSGQAVSVRAGQPLASIIVGGAALGGWVPALSSSCSGASLIDSVQAGARWLRQHG